MLHVLKHDSSTHVIIEYPRIPTHEHLLTSEFSLCQYTFLGLIKKTCINLIKRLYMYNITLQYITFTYYVLLLYII
jgi:hypothetical protein